MSTLTLFAVKLMEKLKNEDLLVNLKLEDYIKRAHLYFTVGSFYLLSFILKKCSHLNDL